MNRTKLAYPVAVLALAAVLACGGLRSAVVGDDRPRVAVVTPEAKTPPVLTRDRRQIAVDTGPRGQNGSSEEASGTHRGGVPVALSEPANSLVWF